MAIPLTFRSVVAVSVALAIAFGIIMFRSTKEKKDYDTVTGKITYLDVRLGELPYRYLGLYRYIKIDGYSYPFEVYTDEQNKRVDSLKTGDVVTAYFYQTNDTEKIGLNRFMQFLDKGSKTYFKRGALLLWLGIASITMLVLLCIGCYWAYKKGKISY
jgi:hypothetical protein